MLGRTSSSVEVIAVAILFAWSCARLAPARTSATSSHVVAVMSKKSKR